MDEQQFVEQRKKMVRRLARDVTNYVNSYSRVGRMRLIGAPDALLQAELKKKRKWGSGIIRVINDEIGRE